MNVKPGKVRPKVRPAQWMSFTRVELIWDPLLATKALVLSALCLEKGLILTEEDLFAPTRCGVNLSGDKPEVKSKADAVKKTKEN